MYYRIYTFYFDIGVSFRYSPGRFNNKILSINTVISEIGRLRRFTIMTSKPPLKKPQCFDFYLS